MTGNRFRCLPSERDDRNEWTPTVKFYVQKWSGYTPSSRTVYEIEWMDRPIELVVISAYAPRSHIEDDKQVKIIFGEVGKRFGPGYLKLGHFSPGKEGAANFESRR